MAVTLTETIDLGQRLRVYTVTAVDLASLAAVTTREESVTVTGVAATDYLLAVIPPTGVGLQVGAGFVSAANTVKFYITNPTAGAVDPAAATYIFVVVATS